MREDEFDRDEFDPNPASHPQGKDIIDRGNPRFVCSRDDIEDSGIRGDSPTSGGCRTDTSAFVVGACQVWPDASCAGYRLS